LAACGERRKKKKSGKGKAGDIYNEGRKERGKRGKDRKRKKGEGEEERKKGKARGENIDGVNEEDVEEHRDTRYQIRT
jgi:hypothetical protein